MLQTKWKISLVYPFLPEINAFAIKVAFGTDRKLINVWKKRLKSPINYLVSEGATSKKIATYTVT